MFPNFLKNRRNRHTGALGSENLKIQKKNSREYPIVRRFYTGVHQDLNDHSDDDDDPMKRFVQARQIVFEEERGLEEERAEKTGAQQKSQKMDPADCRIWLRKISN